VAKNYWLGWPQSDVNGAGWTGPAQSVRMSESEPNNKKARMGGISSALAPDYFGIHACS